MDYKEKEVNELVDRIMENISEEFDKTKHLGAANHFMAFMDVYSTILLFFLAQATGEEGVYGMIQALHEEEKSIVGIWKKMNEDGKLSTLLN